MGDMVAQELLDFANEIGWLVIKLGLAACKESSLSSWKKGYGTISRKIFMNASELVSYFMRISSKKSMRISNLNSKIPKEHFNVKTFDLTIN